MKMKMTPKIKTTLKYFFTTNLAMIPLHLFWFYMLLGIQCMRTSDDFSIYGFLEFFLFSTIPIFIANIFCYRTAKITAKRNQNIANHSQEMDFKFYKVLLVVDTLKLILVTTYIILDWWL